MSQILTRTRSALEMSLVLLVALSICPGFAWSHGGGGGGGDGSGGNDVLGQFVKGNSGNGNGGKGGNGGKWSPPGGAPQPPGNGTFVIELDIPIRLEPVANNEVVDLVEIGPGIGGHPGSGRLNPGGPVVLVGYVDITKIVYNKDLGWVGLTRGLKTVKLPMTPFIQQLINNAMRGQ